MKWPVYKFWELEGIQLLSLMFFLSEWILLLSLWFLMINKDSLNTLLIKSNPQIEKKRAFEYSIKVTSVLSFYYSCLILFWVKVHYFVVQFVYNHRNQDSLANRDQYIGQPWWLCSTDAQQWYWMSTELGSVLQFQIAFESFITCFVLHILWVINKKLLSISILWKWNQLIVF